MKKIIIAFLIIFAALPAPLLNAMPAPDLQELLNSLKKDKGAEGSDTGDNNSESNPLDALLGIGNALGIIPSKTVDVEYLTGEWKYKNAAVAFKSDNFLAKAGGVAAAAKIESELEPYYKRLGLNKMTLTVEADSTFVMKLSKAKLTGTITTEGERDNSKLMFNFKLFGKVPVGTMQAYVNAESNSTMSITFDVSKLLTILEKVAGITGNSTLTTLSKLMNNYEGMTAGFKMTKTSKKSSKK